MHFFSIIVPSHNEEKCLPTTLEYLKGLQYPEDRFEVIVVENGSSDRTLLVAQPFESPTIKIFSSTEKGVSKARNFALAKRSRESEWIVSLDADTLLEKNFLMQLNDFLIRNASKNLVVGTTEVRPATDSIVARFWFFIYNLGHKLTKTSMAIQLFRSSLFPPLAFPEDLRMGEDLKVIKDALHIGNFFYFPTGSVSTSVRRFEQEGWIKIFLEWNFVALLPVSLQKNFDYKVVR